MISPLASPMRGWRNLTPFRARGRGGQNPWTPAQLAPFAWYDVALGGSATQITDSSGNGRGPAVYGAATAAPAYDANTKRVTFDGSNDLIDIPQAAVPSMAAADSFSIFLAFRQPLTPNNFAAWASTKDVSGATSGAGAAVFPNGTARTVAFSIGDGINGASLIGSSFGDTTGVVVGAVVAARTSITLYANGTATSGGGAPLAAVGSATRTNGMRLGRHVTSSGYQAFVLAAVVLLDRAATVDEVARVTSYYGGGV